VVPYRSFNPPPASPATPPDIDLEVRAKVATDSIYRRHAAGSFGLRKIAYRSSVGDLDIPAYVFTPQDLNLGDRRPALVWVRGSTQGDWSPAYLPFVKEAVSRGYVVIAPEYRGSTGYGPELYDALDYGGYEVEDVISAVDYAREHLPFVDTERVALMGWNHGGLITLLAVFRESHPFRAAIAIGPVTNLIFRLAYKGPSYQELFLKQRRIGALPHERPDIYIDRSPLYQVNKLRVPLMVHVATNDEYVSYTESQMLIHALQVEQPELAEIHVYDDPPGGHAFSRMVNTHFEIIDTPAMRDTWSRTWSFFERHLTPVTSAPQLVPVGLPRRGRRSDPDSVRPASVTRRRGVRRVPQKLVKERLPDAGG
jgi:dipeptidyl aminopeptidase/acylaminoacyl peptidase